MLSHRRRDKFSKIAGMNARIVVLSRLLNCDTDVEERTERDRAFHVDAAADWKDRSPMVERNGGDPVVQFPCTSHPSYTPSVVDRYGTDTGLQSDADETGLLQLGTLRRASQ